MAGTKVQMEGLPGFFVSFLLAATDTPQNSLQGGIDVSRLPNRATCWVEETGLVYRWDDSSTATPDSVTVILPFGQVVGTPGRWLVMTAEQAGVSQETNFISDSSGVSLNNYNPTGWDDADGLLLNPTGNIAITGFAAPTGPTKPHRKRLVNDGSGATIQLLSLNGGSDPTNQIRVAAGCDTGNINSQWDLIYDSTNSLWFALGDGSTT